MVNATISLDVYADAIRDASVEYLLTFPSTEPFALEYREQSGCGFQLGQDGGGSIADGTSRDDAFLLMLRRFPNDGEIVLNGEPVHDDDLIVLAPRGRFIFSCQGPRQWLSIALPVSLLSALAPSSGRNWNSNVEGIATTVPSRPNVVMSVIKLTEQMMQDSIGGRTSSHSASLASEVIAMSVGLLSSAGPHLLARRSDENDSAFHLVSRALSVVHTSANHDHRVEDLAEKVGVGPRSLQRAFNRVIQMGPKRYLRIRQLNLVRRALNRVENESTQVTHVLTDFGVSEFGRFSGEYKVLFGELPSETLKRALDVTGTGGVNRSGFSGVCFV